MFGGLFVAALICTGYEAIKDACQPTVPAENWANKDLYYKDMMSGVSPKQLEKNLRNGKYIIREVYPEPHRDPKTGKIVVENEELYREDIYKYGAYQAQKWMRQGKYNLTPLELAKQRKKYEEKWKCLRSTSK